MGAARTKACQQSGRVSAGEVSSLQPHGTLLATFSHHLKTDAAFRAITPSIPSL